MQEWNLETPGSALFLARLKEVPIPLVQDSFHIPCHCRSSPWKALALAELVFKQLISLISG